MARASVRFSVLLVAAAVLLLAFAGCGSKKSHGFLSENPADKEGGYQKLGSLLYQVQISRLLNPRDPEDRAYLAGLPPAEAKLAPDEAWFALFVRVQNETDKPHRAASEFQIVDTLDKRVAPVSLPRSNPFAYQPREIAPDGLLPSAQSTAANGPVQQGALLLFKMKVSTLGNRPLELHIRSPEGGREEGITDLDV